MLTRLDRFQYGFVPLLFLGKRPGVFFTGTTQRCFFFICSCQAPVNRGQFRRDAFLVAVGGRRPSVSTDGTLVYSTGVRQSQLQLAWFDRQGNELDTAASHADAFDPLTRGVHDDEDKTAIFHQPTQGTGGRASSQTLGAYSHTQVVVW